MIIVVIIQKTIHVLQNVRIRSGSVRLSPMDSIPKHMVDGVIFEMVHMFVCSTDTISYNIADEINQCGCFSNNG